MIPETNPSPEPTIIPETYPIPTTQPDETCDSPSLVTNSKDNFSKPASAISGNLQKLRNKKEIQLLPNYCPIALYDRLGSNDPSNEYITNYKEISKVRPTKNNNLLELYNVIQAIELRN